MQYMKVFAILVPLFILWSLVTGEIPMMNQLDKTRSAISYANDPIAYLFSIGAMIVLEGYLLKQIFRSGRDGDSD